MGVLNCRPDRVAPQDADICFPGGKDPLLQIYPVQVLPGKGKVSRCCEPQTSNDGDIWDEGCNSGSQDLPSVEDVNGASLRRTTADTVNIDIRSRKRKGKRERTTGSQGNRQTPSAYSRSP